MQSTPGSRRSQARPLPPNPYHRVDCRPTRRALHVAVDGTTLVDTDDTVIVFETALEPRHYVDPSLVRVISCAGRRRQGTATTKV